MDRTVCTSNDDIKLLYAEEEDKKFIYDMTFEELDIFYSMFLSVSDFEWEELNSEDASFFSNKPGKDKYLLIQYKDDIIGTISHMHNDAKIENMEIDIWLRATLFTGQGIGTAAMEMLIQYLKDTYNIKTFLTRPWSKNYRGVKSFQKIGFVAQEDFDPAGYYNSEDLEKYGCGEHGIETVNMILTV